MFAARWKSFTSRPGKARSRHAEQRIIVEHPLYRSGVALKDPVPTECCLFHVGKHVVSPQMHVHEGNGLSSNMTPGYHINLNPINLNMQ